ncbi:MAG: ABC transporter ATP-binding protein [Bacteroidia bacterium]
MSSIHIQNLSKSYGDVQALRDVTLRVEPGELFGLIGPDGAGKTSLIKILVTLLKPDSGSAMLEGMDVTQKVKQVRDIIGYMPGNFSLYQDLSIEENLRFFATSFGTTVRENYHLIEDIYVQIEPFKKRRAGALSGGMKQKLALCCALIHKPTVLLLDEPTTGVDAVSRKEFWDMLKRLKSAGITVLVSTPYMDEASLCDRVALIQNGQILAVDKPDAVAAAFPEQLFAVKAKDRYSLIKHLRAWDRTRYCYAFGEEVHLTISDFGFGISESDFGSRISDLGENETELSDSESASEVRNPKSEIENYLLEVGIADAQVREIAPTIEDQFIHLMERSEHA